MGFKEVQSLDCETTITIGGVNKKTNKKNPTSAEGYYLGARRVEDHKKKSGFSNIHVLQTPKGNLGVWGKTDLDRKMLTVTPGVMIRISANGMVPTKNGDMYKFKVEFDNENTVEVSESLDAAPTPSDYSDDDHNADVAAVGYGDDEPEQELEEEEPALDEVPPARPTRQATAQPPSQAQQDKVRALLGKSRGAAR